MSSSRIERPVPRFAPLVGRPAAADTHRRWFKRVLPRSLFGRSLIIIILPLILVLLIATWIFYDRVWDTVARRLSAGVAGEIELVLDTMPNTQSEAVRAAFFARVKRTTDLDFSLSPQARFRGQAEGVRSGGLVERYLAAALDERLHHPFAIDASDPRSIFVTVELPHGVARVAVPRQRLYTSATYIFVLWMAGSSLVLLAVASLFMRNQVRALRRLAAAAESFGKGRDVPAFRLEGATEVRQAAAAFLKMRDRIRRQITQRTEMLAGVSHDLRTPLTRMRLALEFVEGAPAEELRADVAAMERMVHGYLDFARGEGPEQPRETDLTLLIEEAAAAARRDGADIACALPEECVLPLRPDAIRRCLGNLLGNARRYARHIWVSAVPAADHVDVLIDDDGPGIPAAERENVFRPFFRLDDAAPHPGAGIGLGLTIARDVARGHGGELTLEEAPKGGLRVRLHLPR